MADPTTLHAGYWPGPRLASLHAFWVRQLVDAGEQPLLAELLAIPKVIACATDDERAQMRAPFIGKQGGH
jgi:hypothetical protein